MKSPRNVIILLTALALVALILATPVFGAPSQSGDAQGNLLNNGSFEGSTYMYNNDGDMKYVPTGWTPWWTQSGGSSDCSTGNPPSFFTKPHYELEQHPTHVKDGISSARWWTGFAVHRAGLYQNVPATPGSTYKFNAYAFAWSSTDGVVDGQSGGPVDLRVGIDPGGGTNGDGGSVVWGNTVATVDQFVPLEAQATATASTITVFLYARPYWCFQRNDSFWDAATLVLTASGPTPAPGGPPPAQPTQKPSSGVPVGSIVAATPQSDGSIIHTVHSGESCIGIAYTYSSVLGIDPTKTLEQIYALNNLNNVSCRAIYPGQRLTIRAAGAAPAPTVAPTEEAASGGETGGESQATPTQQVAEVKPAIICVMAYDDRNGNGLPEPTEPKAAGLTFTVSNGTATVGTYTSDGVNEPHCFNNLQAGNYAVSWASDTFTGSEQTWQTSVGAGQTMTHNFAVSSGEAGEPPPSGGGSVSGPGAESGEGLPLWATALIAAVGVILFLGGLGVAGYFLLMRRRV